MSRYYPQDLPQLLAKNIAPIYFLYGPEAFLLQESAQLIRAKIQSMGEVEILNLTLDNTATSEALALLEQPSLFTPRRLVDIKIKKFTAPITTALTTLLSKNLPDTYFLLQSEQLSRQQQQASWFKPIQQQGVVMGHWPLSGGQFTQWVQRRAQQYGVTLKGSILQTLIYHTEGNCLAAAQEIDRLRLDHSVGATLWIQQSQFTITDLTEAILQKDLKRIIKILGCLREADPGAIGLIIWALTQLTQILLKCGALAPEQQTRCLQQAGIRTGIQALYLKTLKNFDLSILAECRYRLAQADQQLKSGESHDPWQNLLTISLRLTGAHLAAIMTEF